MSYTKLHWTLRKNWKLLTLSFLQEVYLYRAVLYLEHLANGNLAYSDAYGPLCRVVRKLSYYRELREYACTSCPICWGWWDNGRKKTCLSNNVNSGYLAATSLEDKVFFARLLLTIASEAIPRWRREWVLRTLRRLGLWKK